MLKSILTKGERDEAHSRQVRRDSSWQRIMNAPRRKIDNVSEPLQVKLDFRFCI